MCNHFFSPSALASSEVGSLCTLPGYVNKRNDHPHGARRTSCRRRMASRKVTTKPDRKEVAAGHAFVGYTSYVSTIGTQHLSIDPATIRANEESHHIGNVFRRAETLER